MQMTWFFRSNPVNAISIRGDAQTQIKNDTYFHTFLRWQLDTALQTRQIHTVKRSIMKTENQNAYAMSPTPHPIISIRQHFTPHTPRPRTRTHIVLGLLVGAGIQQQPRTVRVTIASGFNQRRISVLRPPPPICAHICDRRNVADDAAHTSLSRDMNFKKSEKYGDTI